jgi:TIR domain
MSDIFLSYDHRDFDRVNVLVAPLQMQGWTVFFDPEIPAGKTWRQFIGKEIDECRCMVVVWSTHSVNSHWVCEEADIGLKRKILVPLLLDQVTPPLGFGSIQAASLVGWQGEIGFSGYLALCKAVTEHLRTGMLSTTNVNSPTLASSPHQATSGSKASVVTGNDRSGEGDHVPSPPTALPDPLPVPPGEASLYLDNLKEEIEASTPLSFQDQSALLLRLKEHLSDPDESEDVRSLLEQLKKRDDLYARVATEIDGLLTPVRKKTSREKSHAPSTKSTQRPGRPLFDIKPPKSPPDPNSIAIVPDAEPTAQGQVSVIDKSTGHLKIIIHEGHTIEYTDSLFGLEKIFYDGREVSRKRSVLGSTHEFWVKEKGKKVFYEVKIDLQWAANNCTWLEVRRNGVVIYSDC